MKLNKLSTIYKLTAMALLFLIIGAIVYNVHSIELFRNTTYNGVYVDISTSAYKFIGHNKPIEDIHIINNTYIVLDTTH